MNTSLYLILYHIEITAVYSGIFISHILAKNIGCGYQASMKRLTGQRQAYSDPTLPRRIAVGPTLAWYSCLNRRRF